jgi:two-component system, cell cycle sensor histidine kinase and response regulator CckA
MKSELERLRLRCAELENKLDQSEKSRRESEEWFRKIFHASSNMMAIHTIKEGRFVDINEAAASLGGFKREELIGCTMSERNLVDGPDLREMTGRKLSEEGRIRNIELKTRGKNGEIRTVLASLDPITVNNEPCVLAVSVDITEREERADSLQRSEEKYRVLVENSLQGIAIVQDGRLVFCNNALAKMTGYSVEELLAFPDSRDLLHPEDQEAVNARHQDRMAGRSVPAHQEHRIVKKDGTACWMEVQACVIEYNRKPAMQVVSMDISERKQAEEALRESKEYLNQIINCIGDPIFVKDREHRFMLVNDAFCAFDGRPREELLGKMPSELLPRERATLLLKHDESIFISEKSGVSEDSFRDGQGDLHSFLAKKSLLTDKNGNKQIVCALRDITEFKRLQAQFLQAQKMEAIGVLAGGVAHDFNNLLNVINGYCELMLNDLPEHDPKRHDIEQISLAGKRAASLTSQLLAFSRKQIMQPIILDLNAVITGMSSMLRRLIRENIELNTTTQSDLGMINADPGQIQQVVMNLAINARDAILLGGKLTIETANVSLDEEYVRQHPEVKAGAYVMLAISDNGLGMDEDTKSHLFEPFFTTKQRGKGTGLGLPTVYGIVKQSNGFIWVYSELGKGTTFKIYFPRIAGAVSLLAEEGKAEQAIKGVETVLLAEDDASLRALTGRVLRERGYMVFEASNGKEALDIAGKYAGEIHLVITDVVMPGLGGKELVSRLTASRPGIKALYASGYTDNAIVHHGVLDSGVAFLQKPFTVENLSRKVRAVLDS